MTRSQAVMDALNDAETLRLYAAVYVDDHGPLALLDEANAEATEAARFMGVGSIEAADACARFAAHYAFRAVPGLRGE